MRMLRLSVEALLRLPLRQRSVPYMLHGDLAVSELRRNHHHPGGYWGAAGQRQLSTTQLN
jgi:hypothetical protein